MAYHQPSWLGAIRVTSLSQQLGDFVTMLPNEGEI